MSALCLNIISPESTSTAPLESLDKLDPSPSAAVCAKKTLTDTYNIALSSIQELQHITGKDKKRIFIEASIANLRAAQKTFIQTTQGAVALSSGEIRKITLLETELCEAYTSVISTSPRLRYEDPELDPDANLRIKTLIRSAYKAIHLQNLLSATTKKLDL